MTPQHFESELRKLIQRASETESFLVLELARIVRLAVQELDEENSAKSAK